MFAGPGNDVVFVRDGEPDVVSCGHGYDIVFADPAGRDPPGLRVGPGPAAEAGRRRRPSSGSVEAAPWRTDSREGLRSPLPRSAHGRWAALRAERETRVSDRHATRPEAVAESPCLDLAGGEGQLGDDVLLSPGAGAWGVLGDDAREVGGAVEAGAKASQRQVRLGRRRQRRQPPPHGLDHLEVGAGPLLRGGAPRLGPRPKAQGGRSRAPRACRGPRRWTRSGRRRRRRR